MGCLEGETAEPAQMLAAQPGFKTNNAKGKKFETTAAFGKPKWLLAHYALIGVHSRQLGHAAEWAAESARLARAN